MKVNFEIKILQILYFIDFDLKIILSFIFIEKNKKIIFLYKNVYFCYFKV